MLEVRGAAQVELERGVQAARALRPGTEREGWWHAGAGPGPAPQLGAQSVRVEDLRWVTTQARGGLVREGEAPAARGQDARGPDKTCPSGEGGRCRLPGLSRGTLWPRSLRPCWCGSDHRHQSLLQGGHRKGLTVWTVCRQQGW